MQGARWATQKKPQEGESSFRAQWMVLGVGIQTAEEHVGSRRKVESRNEWSHHGRERKKLQSGRSDGKQGSESERVQNTRVRKPGVNVRFYSM